MSSVDQRVKEFFASLERALGGSNEQSDAVQAELRADLEVEVREAVAGGMDRDLAWTEALEAMGEPEALGRSMRGSLPPAPPKPMLRNLRVLAAGLTAAWALGLLFEWRSTDYGFEPRMMLTLLGIHLPLVLLLWPGLVWRWNPLFSTGASVVFGVLLVALEVWARSTPVTYEFGVSTGLATPGHSGMPGAVVADRAWRLADLIPIVFAGLIVVMFTLLQRSRQRWLAVAWTLGLLAPIEVVHQVEEGLFRAEARHAEIWTQARVAERGGLPTSEEFREEYEPRWLSRLHYYTTGDSHPDGSPEWALHWSRATQNNHELMYSSKGEYRGND